MNANETNTKTVDLSDLNFVSAINLDLMTACDSEIETDDLISYVDDNGVFSLGFYVTLYAYETKFAGETSPWFNDNRVMAYVRKIDGGTDYADIETIVKLVDAFPTMAV